MNGSRADSTHGEPKSRGVVGVDHVALAVTDIDSAQVWFVEKLGLAKTVDVVSPDGRTRVAFFDCGNTSLQLIQPMEAGDLADHIAENGEGLHHICFSVEDIRSTLTAMPESSDVEIFPGGVGLPVCFLAERPSGLLIELIENPATQESDVDGG